MKRRTWILSVLCLLSVAGLWVYCSQSHPGQRASGNGNGNQNGAAVAGQKSAATTTTTAKAAVSGKVSTLNTNKLAYRLANTTNSIRELESKPHAILLANAFIDTDKPLDLKLPAHLRSAGDPGAYIVQARGPIDARFRNLVAAAGAQVVSYIPNNAYLVNLAASGAGRLAGNPLVQAVLPYEPYYKLQSSLLGLAVNEQPLPPGTALTLGLFAADAAAGEAQLVALGARIIGHDQSPFGPVVRVLAPTDWTALVQSPAVQFAEPARTRVVANDISRVTLGVSVDTLAPTNYLNLYGSNVLVAVNDSGVDVGHPDFSFGGSAGAPGSVPPSRVAGLTPLDLVDTNGHGTHVAGIIAGNGSMSLNPVNVGSFAEGSISNADFRGKAPMANLFSLHMGGYTDYQLQTNAALKGALISNNSWDYGNGDPDYDLAAASYDFATRDALPGTIGSQPVLFVFAAGNDADGNNDGTGGGGDTILSPGTAKNVITVGALEQPRGITNIVTFITGVDSNGVPVSNNVAYWQPQTDSGNQVAWYSSRGNVGIGIEGNNGRFKPDVVSPGTFVVSTSSQFNHEWDTNAYYNPTNVLGTAYTDQVVASNGLAYYNVPVPPNAVGITISVYPNNLSPNPFPILPIYCQQSGIPDPVNNPGAIDITSWTDGVSIPPGGGACVLPGLDANGFDIAVGNTNSFTVNYNLTVSIQVTNDEGNMYAVLEGMNDSLGGYYRYESGTSMAAASVSGILALIQDYFTNQFQPPIVPSPALLKAVLINGARSVGDYGLAFTNGLNYQGWGQENIQNCVPAGGLFNQFGGPEGSSFFVDQSPTNALATGDSHTYTITMDPNNFEQFYQLQATLVWTDPPGDPAAAIKLVNSLTLIVTNLDTGDVNYGSVYYGNDIEPDIGYNLPWNTNTIPNIDTVNNVQSVLLPPLLAGSYSVTVVGRSVNVNAVTAQTNNALGQYAPNIVQDYALVISVGEGEVTNAFRVTDNGITSNPTGDQNFTVVISTNAPLVNQMVGASSPLLGTNTLPLGTNTVWGPNGVLTIGQTNQWHFYVVTNTGIQPDYTNAAFITFQVDTLSIPRMGVYESVQANATTPEANLDMFVTDDPSITNLNPVAISNCLAGVGNSRASLYNAGTQFVYYTNSVPGSSVYYIGVQSADQMAAEYDFLPVFTDVPFSSLDQNGNQIVNGLLLPMPTPQGNNAHPGITNIFALAIMPMEVEKVIVTNLNEHQNFGDLFGSLSFSGQYAILNNHDGFGNTFGHAPIVYDDTRDHPLGTTNTDGPGSLTNFLAKSALGPWILTELDDSAGGYTGQVSRLTLLIQPHRNLKQPGIIVSVPPGGWFVDWVDVPAGYTNLTFYATNITIPVAFPPIQMYEKLGDEPTLTDYDQEDALTNGNPEGNTISIGPPLAMGRYFVGLYNPNQSVSQNVFLSATLGINATANDIYNYSSTVPQTLFDDSVTPTPGPDPSVNQANPLMPGSTIKVPATVTNLVTSVNVGLVVNSPRISDYAFTLVSPTGQRVLLMENRGGEDTNGAGMEFVYTNVLNSTATGGAAANTNYLAVSPLGEVVPITWNFYTVPDQMTVYNTTNPADFILNSPYMLYNTGMTNNPSAGPGGGAQNTIPVTYDLSVPPGVTNLTIIMNQFGNPYATEGDAWIYTAGAPNTNYEYLEFTDDTNLATVPIKFAEPPFNFLNTATNFTLSDLDAAVATNYFGPTNIADGFGTGWSVPTNLTLISTVVNVTNGQFVLVTNTVVLTNNLVSVVTDPSTAVTGDAGGSNYLALGNGTITRAIPTVPGETYNVTFWYRGPGIAGWWRGEGNATDSSDPENDNNNGTLVGRFNFPAGEVSQAFEFADLGNTYQFAGTNTYVQVPASPSLNVGAGGGFTVEGWINPTNLTRPEPLVEWLAAVPTNPATADTNLVIVQGPVLNPATGHYYYLLASTNWTVSEKWAKSLGGDLVTLETANEDEWVYDTFTAYGTLNRDLWTGLQKVGATYQWVSGVTNIAYTNWVPGEPFAACPPDQLVAIMGPTNAYPGLWKLEGDGRETCAVAPTNPIYGVVEVSSLPTNGVQFWVSGTNWTPGLTNTMQGSLCANIVDTNYVSHWIFSAPGLLTNNVYQHVALTFNTNSGVAALYLNGTNVATSNLYTPGTSFTPKTDGDLLLGWDMSLYTNNFYGGEMDEMSIYGRALSLAEIWSIYNVSASTTNRLIGKFDPAITPAVGLAEAAVIFGTTSNTIFGVNDQWEVNSYTFTATSNSLPLTIVGIAPGILLDAFAVQSAPQTNLYYFPEQALAGLNGTAADGNWTLQVWDSRAGAYVTNVNQLVNWQLSFVLSSNALVSASLPAETPITTTVPSGQIVYYSVTVPAWAHEATNVLVSSSLPVQLLFNPTNLPTGVNPGDVIMLPAPQTSGVGQPILTVNSPLPLQAAQAGQTYYLGVQNTNAQSATVVLEVDYDLVALTNGVPFTDVLTNEYSAVRYFSYDVSTNAYEATFQLLQMSGNADLVVSKGAPLPSLNNENYGSFNTSNADESIYVLTNSAPVPLSGGRWYVGVVNRDGTPIQYSVLAKELDVTNSVITNGIMPAIITLTNGVPFAWTAGPGAALTNFFHFQATNAVVSGTNVYLYGLRFELFNLSGNGDLTLQSNALPLAPPFFETSQNGGTSPELIYVFTNSVLTNLAADWYLGVPNVEVTNINYTIIAEVLTNGYFPAFPGAEGAGGGALGGRFGDVYHVISTADSGYGTLRDAVTSMVTNRTVVFDVSGTINLASPLVITNSNLTIAGETSPGGGITVGGQMTTVQSAHDVVIRDVRFRSIAGSYPVTVWENGFEGGGSGPSAGQYFAGGWYVDFGTIDLLSTGDPAGSTAYEGTNYIDLDGSSAGGISTNIATIPGQVYMLNFAYARNPDSINGVFGHPPGTPQASVLINGQQLATVTANYLNSWSNLDWQLVSYVFTAPSASTHLAIHSLDVASSISGVLLDAFSLSTNAIIYDSFQGTGLATYTQGQVVRGWTVLTNEASIVTDAANSYIGHSNFLALANGIVSNNLPTVAGRTYTLSLAYRGPGIAGWWRGEGNVNSSVYGNNATNPPNFAYPYGKVGQGINFNGSEFASIPPSASLAVTNITIEGWINPSTTSLEPVVEYGGPGQYSAIHFWVNGWGLSSIPGMLFANVRPSEPELYTAAGIVPQNTWTHVAFTMDVTSGVLIIYCNGAQAAFKQMPAPVATPPTAIQPLNLGYRNASTLDTFQGYKYAGGMDEMSIYNRALSPSEIQAIYARGSAGKFDPAVFSSAPDQSLAEAVISIPGITNGTLLGNNTNWQQLSFTFKAASGSTPVVIQGVEPGMLLDAVSAETSGELGGSLQFNAVSNVIADHVSASWSTNAELAVLSSTNVTVQWSIMADSLHASNNYQSTGSLLREGSGTLSFHHNLYADNYTGSPRLGDNLTLDFVNNVIYNWGAYSGWSDGKSDLSDFSPNGSTNLLNYVGNYLIAGPDTAAFAANHYNITNIAFFGGVTNAQAANWIFQTNNFIDSDTNGVLNGADTGWNMFTNDYTRFSRAFPTPPVSVDEAYQAYEKVLAFAGVNLALRDPADTNIVTSVRAQTGRLISSAPTLAELNSQFPYLDTDQDGIPDFWEDTFTPTLVYLPSQNNDRNGDGYTDLEEYNNWLAGPHALTATNTPVGIDLYQLCGESGHLAFFVTNSIHGQVYLTNVLGTVANTSPSWSNSIAVFTPTNSTAGGTNYFGYASFDCYVTNLDTEAYFGPVTVSVIVSAVPLAINTNFPPVVIPLTSGVADDPCIMNSSLTYSIVVTTNDYGALFELDAPTGPMALVISDQPYPSLSNYKYYTNQPASPATLQIAVLTNSAPTPLHAGTWYMTAVNEAGINSNVCFTAMIRLLGNIYAPAFLYPSNGTVITTIETVPLTNVCVAVDTNSPPLPLAFTLLNGPVGLTITPTGVISWTPTEAQGGTTNPVAVSVSNGPFSVTNDFTIVVEISNVPPVLPVIPLQFVIVPGGQLLVTNTAINPNLPAYPLTYALFTTVTGTNQPNIDTNGIITWSPVLAQADMGYLFTTVVTDTNPPAVNATSLSATNQFAVIVLTTPLPPGEPFTNIVAPGGIGWFPELVPTNAIQATNSLLYASLPVNVWYSTNLPPAITNANDTELLGNVTKGVSVLNTNLATAPTNIVPGGYYFLGVQNTNLVPVTNVVRIDFDLVVPIPGLTLPAIPDQVVAAGDTLVVTNTASDTNTSAALGYNLVNPPAGASISANGVITWPTSASLAPTNVVITTVVNDSTDNLSATNSFNVLVLPPLPPGEPITNILGPNSLFWRVVKVPTNAIQATNILLFATAPVNLWYSTNVLPSITNNADAELLTNSLGGFSVINSTSAPVLVPGARYFLGVQNTNNFAVTNAVLVRFQLVVPAGPPFAIFSIVATNNAAGANGFLLTWFAPTNDQFHLQWTPSLAPVNWTNLNGVASVMSFLRATNSLFQFFDDGTQTGGFGAERFYRLELLNSPTNTAPFFTNASGLLNAVATIPFVYTNAAQDYDMPAQALTYSVTNTLAGANVTINPTNGVILWTPGVSLVGQTNLITTTVTDSGVPPLSATNTLAVVVSPNVVPAFSRISIGTNGVQFQWTAPQHDQFQIRWTTNLAPANWQWFPNVITSTNTSFSFVDTNTPLWLMKFYQLMLLP